jgi:hypothetical protein
MNDHSKFGASEAYQRHDRTQFFSSNSHNFSNCLFGDLRLEQKEFFYAFQTTSSCHHHPSRFAGPRRERRGRDGTKLLSCPFGHAPPTRNARKHQHQYPKV